MQTTTTTQHCLVCVMLSLVASNTPHISKTPNACPLHGKRYSPHAKECTSQLDRLRLTRVFRLVLELLLFLYEVDQGLQLIELLRCSHMLRRCIVEEFHGITLLNVLSFDKLTQEWFDQTFKGCDIITQLPLYGIYDTTTQFAFLSFSQALCTHLFDTFVHQLANFLRMLVLLLC